MRNRLPGLLVTAALAVVVSACGSGEESEAGGDVPEGQVVAPADAPSGWEVAVYEGVSVATPGGWEESTSQDPEYDATMYNLQTEVNEFGSRGGVQVMTVDAPQRSAEESVNATVTGYQAVVEMSEVETEEIEWPGAESAWFLGFVAEVPNAAGERAPHRVRHLVLDLADGSQVHATVTALADQFDELRMDEVLATVTVR